MPEIAYTHTHTYGKHTRLIKKGSRTGSEQDCCVCIVASTSSQFLRALLKQDVVLYAKYFSQEEYV